MYFSAELTGEIITLQPDLVSHPFVRVLKGCSCSIPGETNQDAGGYLLIVPGKRGLPISWMILVLEVLLLFNPEKRSKQNKKTQQNLRTAFLVSNQAPICHRPSPKNWSDQRVYKNKICITSFSPLRYMASIFSKSKPLLLSRGFQRLLQTFFLEETYFW